MRIETRERLVLRAAWLGTVAALVFWCTEGRAQMVIRVEPATKAADAKPEVGKQQKSDDEKAGEAKPEAKQAEVKEKEKPETAEEQPKPKAKEGYQAVPEKKDAEVKRVPTARAAVAPALRVVVGGQNLVVGAPDAQAKAMIQQFEMQLRPLMVGELNFARQVCEIPEEHRPKVRAAGQKGLSSAAEQMAKQQQRGVAVQEPFGLAIQREVEKALEEVLPAEQLAQYQAEATARTEQRKRAVVLSMAGQLEEALGLDAEQRDKVAEALDTKWRDEWHSWLILSRYGDQYFPPIPDEILTPHISEPQKSIWDSLQKIHLGGFNGMMGQPADDLAWWGDAQPAPVEPIELAVEAAEAPAAKPAGAALGEAFLKAISNLFKAGQKK